MQVARVKRLKIKDEIHYAAILEVSDKVPLSVVVLARRDVIRLQTIFRDIFEGRKPNIIEISDSIRRALNRITRERDQNSDNGISGTKIHNGNGHRKTVSIPNIRPKA